MVVLGDGVGVPAECDAGISVPESVRNGFNIYAVRERLCSLGVTQLVEFDARESMFFTPGIPLSLEIPLIVNRTYVGADHGCFIGLFYSDGF